MIYKNITTVKSKIADTEYFTVALQKLNISMLFFRARIGEGLQILRTQGVRGRYTFK